MLNCGSGSKENIKLSNEAIWYELTQFLYFDLLVNIASLC